MSDLRVRLILQAIDRATAPLRRVNAAMSSLTRPARQIGAAVAGFARAAGVQQLAGAIGAVAGRAGEAAGAAARLGTKLALAGGAAGFLFKREFLDTAVEFERFSTILETLEGSGEKAKQAMSWVEEFAVKTPFELREVMDSFVKLRSYGLDPTNGLLKTLGDTAAAMGKPINQAVEAIADAVTGEGERLKEFGIIQRQVGRRMVYEYTVNGKTMRKVAQRGNRAMIQETLTAIWNEKYGGAMERLAKTFEGMVSNLLDHWGKFKRMIMANGAFDWLKTKAEELLATIDEMGKSGELQQLAAEFGTKLVAGLKAAWEAFQELMSAVRTVASGLMWLRDLFGSWTPIVAAVAAVIAGPLILALANLGIALVPLGLALTKVSIALLATPVGWFLGAVAAIAAAAYLVYDNWEDIARFFEDLWGGVTGAFERASAVIGRVLDEISGFFKTKWAAITKPLDKVLTFFGVGAGGGEERQGVAGRPAPFRSAFTDDQGRPMGGARRGGIGPDRTEVGGKMEVIVRAERGASATIQSLESRSPNFEIEADAGYSMGY